jgi:sugar phosphate isomerase/epimerase
MKLSVMLFPFHGELVSGQITPQDVVRTLKAGGATGVEAMTSFGDSHPEHWAALMAAIAGEGLRHVCLDVGANFVWTTPVQCQQVLDNIKRGLDFAASVQCPVVLLPGSGPAEGMSNEEGRRRYGEGLGEAAALAAEYGIIATIEDFGVTPKFSCRSDHVLEIIRATGRDDVRLTWDNGNFILADEDPLHAWEAFAPLTAHVHIKDFALDPSGQAGLKSPAGKAFVGCEIGAGEARVVDSLRTVKGAGYDGWISLEISIGPALDAAAQGLEFMSRAYDEA